MLESDFDISKLTSFKVGGKVKKVCFPATEDEFVEILKSEPDAKIFGNLSNTLISSFGYDGTIILTTKMDNVEVSGQEIYVQCGVKGPKLSQIAQQNGLSGFEFMIGFPGSAGGNVCMNASAHAQCISDKLVSVRCFDGEKVIELSKEDMKFEYRHSVCSDNEKIVVLSAKFVLDKADKDVILQKMDENLKFRKEHQPSLALPNCGSVFKNPEGDSAGRLLDSVGAKNMNVGGAKVWDNHANFIINENNATSLDILKLMKMMSDAVKVKYGIKLMPEVKFLGGKNKEEEDIWLTLK